MCNEDDIEYEVILKITDKQMRNSDGSLASFNEVAEVAGKTQEEARILAIFLAQEVWDMNQYDIKVELCRERK